MSLSKLEKIVEKTNDLMKRTGTLQDLIGKGEYKGQKYEVYTVFCRESTLINWYIVCSELDLDKGNELEQMEKIYDVSNNACIDVRKYGIRINAMDSMFHKDKVFEQIKNKVETGEIEIYQYKE